MRFGYIILSILFLISLSFSGGPNTPEINLPTLGIVFLAIIAFLSVGIVALAYMLGSFLQSPQVIAWAKGELQQVIASVILVVILWSVVSGTDVMVNAIFLHDSDGGSLSELGSEALEPHIQYMETLYLKVADAYQTIGLMQGFGYFASVGIVYAYVGQGASPYYGTSILLGPLAGASNNLTIQILTFRLIKVFTYYLEGVFPMFLFPIALAFRMFPFTRKLGNTLIAISLGVMLVLPLSMLFVSELWHATAWQYKSDVLKASFSYDDMELGGVMDFVQSIVDFLCEAKSIRFLMGMGEFGVGLVYSTIVCAFAGLGFMLCFLPVFWTFITAVWPLWATLIYLVAGALTLLPFSASFADSVAPSLDVIPNLLLPAIVEATGFSIVSLFIISLITISGIKSISIALGGDYVLYGVSRFL